MQPEKKDECAGDRGEERAVLAQERADGAGGSSKRDEDKREARDKRQGGSKKASAGRLSLAQLLHADAGEHGDVTGYERENAGRKKGNQTGEGICGQINGRYIYIYCLALSARQL